MGLRQVTSFLFLLSIIMQAPAEIILQPQRATMYITRQDANAPLSGIILLLPVASDSLSISMARNLNRAHSWSSSNGHGHAIVPSTILLSNPVLPDRQISIRSNMARARAYSLDSYR